MNGKAGKIVYQPPERCYSKVNIEETEHGYKLYRDGRDGPFTFIPHNRVISIEYHEER